MTTHERIEFTAPVQPPPGSVVLDKDGLAWQRLTVDEPAWRTAGADRPTRGTRGAAASWPYLIVDGGPLTLVFRADEPTTEEAGQ